MEARIFVHNMGIEVGARAGMIAPDESAFDKSRGHIMAPVIEM